MSDEKKYSLRQMVMAQRDAFLAAFGPGTSISWTEAKGETRETAFAAEAQRRFPLPQTQVPRVITLGDPSWQARDFRFVGGTLQSRNSGLSSAGTEYPWVNRAQVTATTSNIRALAKLLESPTETVDDDGVAP